MVPNTEERGIAADEGRGEVHPMYRVVYTPRLSRFAHGEHIETNNAQALSPYSLPCHTFPTCSPTASPLFTDEQVPLHPPCPNPLLPFLHQTQAAWIPRAASFLPSPSHLRRHARDGLCFYMYFLNWFHVPKCNPRRDSSLLGK
jgi:hypothetical protein